MSQNAEGAFTIKRISAGTHTGKLTAGVGTELVGAVPPLLLTARVSSIKTDRGMMIKNIVFFSLWILLIGMSYFGRSASGVASWKLLLAGMLSMLVPLADGIGTGARLGLVGHFLD